MNATIDLMQSHRSIRRFTKQAISDKQFYTIISAAKSAASSSFLQCVSIVRVSDAEKRQQLQKLAGDQAYIGSAAEFLVFCIDFNRHQQLVDNAKLGFTEHVLIGSVDAGLMGQNALLAAQSMGLGGVFIGAMRNNPKEVCEALNLPQYVFALFGLCLGTPDQDPAPKPRLPNELIVHDNQYQPLNQEAVSAYDEQTRDYYKMRTDGKITNRSWSSDIADKLSKEARPFILECLQEQGLALK